MNPTRLILSAAIALIAGCTGGSVTPPVVPEEIAKVAVTPTGMAIGASLEGAVPMTGGKIVSADGRLSIDVPAGALTGTQMITVQPISNQAPNGLGVAYRLGPEGVTFAAPVKLTFKYTKEDLVGSEALALRVAYQDKEGRWNAIKQLTLDEVAQTVSVETTHFSDWELFTGYKLTPTSAMTAPGKFVALQVRYCIADDQGSDELAALVSTCGASRFYVADEWAVNGTKGGSSQIGTVTSAGNASAQYLAPGQAPASNPVTVSASVTGRTGQRTLLASTIWIDDHPPLRGEIASLQINPQDPNDFFTTTAQVGFKWNYENEQYEAESGTFIARHDQKNPGGATCEIHTTFEGTIGAQDGAIYIQDGVYFPNGRTLGNFVGTTSCTSSGAVQPLTVYGSAIWWPAPLMSNLTPKPEGELAENLSGIMAHGSKVNVVWSLRPRQ